MYALFYSSSLDHEGSDGLLGLFENKEAADEICVELQTRADLVKAFMEQRNYGDEAPDDADAQWLSYHVSKLPVFTDPEQFIIYFWETIGYYEAREKEIKFKSFKTGKIGVYPPAD